MIDTGHKATLTYQGIPYNIVSMEPGEMSRPDIDASHLLTDTWRQFLPGDLVDPGPWVFNCQFDPAEAAFPIPINEPESMTVTFNISDSSNTVPATLSGTAFTTVTAIGSIETDVLQTVVITARFDGMTGPAWTEEKAA